MRAIAPIRNQALAGDQSIQETHVVCNIVAGVVTLMMACMFAGLWIRAICVHDFIDFGRYIPGSRGIVIDSNDDSFTLMTRDGETLRLSPDGEINTFLPMSDVEVVLVEIITVPYWSIVVPLTLFSAWLLLSRPPIAKTGPCSRSSRH